MATTMRWLRLSALLMHLHSAGLSCSLCINYRRLWICYTESNLIWTWRIFLVLKKFHWIVLTCFVEWNVCTKDASSGWVDILNKYYNQNNSVAMEAPLQYSRWNINPVHTTCPHCQHTNGTPHHGTLSTWWQCINYSTRTKNLSNNLIDLDSLCPQINLTVERNT